MCTPDYRDGSAVPGSRNSGGLAGAEAGDERKTSAVPGSARRRPGRLEAGPFAADVASFRLHLAAENKAAGTIRIYTEAPLWFAAAYLLRETGKTRWEQVGDAGCPAVGRLAAGQLQRGVRAAAVPGAAAVLPVAGRRGRDSRPDGQAACACGAGEAGAVLHQRRTFQAGEGVPGQHVRAAPRRGDPVGVPGDGHPAGRAGRDPLRPRTTLAAATWTWTAGRSCPREGRQGPDRQDRSRGRPAGRPVPPGPGQA